MQVSARLQAIDILLKTCVNTVPLTEAATVLNVSKDEIKVVMRNLGIIRLTKKNFHEIMRRGSSYICKTLNRYAELNYPHVYTLEQVAYIYNLDINDVYQAAEIAGVREATEVTLPLLFYHIYV